MLPAPCCRATAARARGERRFQVRLNETGLVPGAPRPAFPGGCPAPDYPKTAEDEPGPVQPALLADRRHVI